MIKKKCCNREHYWNRTVQQSEFCSFFSHAIVFDLQPFCDSVMQKFTLTNAFLAISLSRKPDSKLLKNDYYNIYVNNKTKWN